MRLKIVAFFFLIPVLAAMAGEVTIRGNAPGAETRTLRLTTFGDLLTQTEVPLASTTIEPDGRFTVSAGIDETMLVTLSIGFHKSEFFVEPGKEYDVQIEQINYDDYTEVNPFIQAQKLTVTIANDAQDELNLTIATFNAVYSSFLMDNFNALYRDRNRAVLDTFRISLNKEFGGIKNPYFTSYATYKFGALEQLTKYHSQALICQKYFTGKPILYYNLEYFEFFNSYFSKYLTATSNTLRKIDFKPMLKSPQAYQQMMKAMTADTLLKPDALRELVLLKGLLEFYNSKEYNQQEVLAVITAIAENSKETGNRTIAANMHTMLTRLTPGTEAPGFSLPDRNQQNVSLKNLRGKPVVLNFWTTYCEGCLTEMDLIRPLYDKYGGQVSFVSISADKYFSKMLYFINLKKDYVWTFLNTGDMWEVLKDYDVRTYPLFVLIDREGKIFKYRANGPGKGLEEDLQKLLEK